MKIQSSRSVEALGSSRCVCRIATNQLDPSIIQPLLLEASGSPKILYPEGNSPSSIQAKIGEAKVRVFCPSSFIQVKFIDQNIRTAQLVCLNRTTLRLTTDSQSYLQQQWQQPLNTLRDLSCSMIPEPVARFTGSRFYPCGSCIEIGFQIESSHFLPVIEYIALDVERLQPLVAYLHILPIVQYRQTGRSVWMYRSGPVFRNLPLRIYQLYTLDYQRKRFKEIFGDSAVVDRYLPKAGNAYLVMGQLISDHYLYYKAEQNCAYMYENVVPIWRNVILGNWELTDELVRRLASDCTAGLHVWSGAIGVLTLATKKIYLLRGQGSGLMPVPKLLFRYAYDEERRRGIAMLTVNDPYLFTGLTEDLIVCAERAACRTAYPQFESAQRGFT